MSIEKNINFCLTDPFLKNKIIHYNEYDLAENTWDASLIRTSCGGIALENKKLKGRGKYIFRRFSRKLWIKAFSRT